MNSPEIIEALWQTDLFKKGIGWVSIARIKAGVRKAAVEIFLVDVWCLGVKRTFHEVCDPEDYRQPIRNYYLSEYPMEQIPPARARSLVEQAVQYAMALGLPPAAGYDKTSRVFAQIPALTEHFTFGRDGKPCYISGPNETEVGARRIVEHLVRRCGLDNFHYMVEVRDR